MGAHIDRLGDACTMVGECWLGFVFKWEWVGKGWNTYYVARDENIISLVNMVEVGWRGVGINRWSFFFYVTFFLVRADMIWMDLSS